MMAMYQVVFRNKKNQDITERYNVVFELSGNGFRKAVEWAFNVSEKYEYPSEITIVAKGGYA